MPLDMVVLSCCFYKYSHDTANDYRKTQNLVVSFLYCLNIHGVQKDQIDVRPYDVVAARGQQMG